MNNGKKSIGGERFERLWSAIMSLESREECESFFSDLCTIAELDEMAKRMHVAVCLRDGMSYNDIADRTGASTATISRVKRSLYYGNDGYQLVLERLCECGEELDNGN